jgi:hypothetical protein
MKESHKERSLRKKKKVLLMDLLRDQNKLHNNI